MILDIVIPKNPKNDAVSHILPGSAIVARPVGEAGRGIAVDYEGNKYGATPDFDQKLARAAYRSVIQYPTIARSHFTDDEFRELFHIVGAYETKTWSIIDLDKEALEKWI